MGPFATSLQEAISLPSELCNIIIRYATNPVLEALFHKCKLADFLTSLNLTLPEYITELDKEKIRCELKKLLSKECTEHGSYKLSRSEDKQLILTVEKATSKCTGPSKELLLKAQTTCWDRDWRLEIFGFISKIIKCKDDETTRKAIFNFYRVVGRTIYLDMGVDALNIPLFQLVLQKIGCLYLIGKGVKNRSHEAWKVISNLIDQEVIYKIYEGNLLYCYNP